MLEQQNQVGEEGDNENDSETNENNEAENNGNCVKEESLSST